MAHGPSRPSLSTFREGIEEALMSVLGVEVVGCSLTKSVPYKVVETLGSLSLKSNQARLRIVIPHWCWSDDPSAGTCMCTGRADSG